MSSLDKKRGEATLQATFRGHTIKWCNPHHGEGNSIQDGYCVECGAWVQVCTNPPANSVDIGGPAVAVNCGTKLEERDIIDGFED